MSYYKLLEHELEKDIFNWKNIKTYTYLADSTVNSRIWHINANSTLFEIIYDFSGTITVYRRPSKWSMSSTNHLIYQGKDDCPSCKELVNLIADNLIDYPY
jgi:hypothetical protein